MFLVVFGSTADSGPNTVPAEPNSPAEAVLKTNIAVTVNGVDITESDVDAEVTQRLGRMRIPPKVPPQFIEQYKKQIRQPALEDLISRVLVDERIRTEVVVTEEEVIAYLERAGAAQKPPLSLDDIKERIRAAGQDFDEVKRDIRRRLGSQKLMEAQWAGRINLTEDDARKHYDENPRLFETPEQVRASHILIKPDTSKSYSHKT
jgi:peptidyl-prolyl cis-trans isomerase C